MQIQELLSSQEQPKPAEGEDATADAGGHHRDLHAGSAQRGQLEQGAQCLGRLGRQKGLPHG